MPRSPDSRGRLRGARARARGARGSRRSRCARTRRAGASPEEECRCGRRSSATATGSSTRSRSAACKDKTQVFVDPEGDHYRTRITHTLETTGDLARRRARAAAERGSRSRRSGSATTSAIRRSATPARRRSTSCCASAFGAASATTSTRCASSRSSSATAAAEPHREVRDGILKHTGRASPRRSRGKIVRLVDRVAYINHDIDDAIRVRACSTRTSCRPTRSRCSATRARGASTRSSTTSSRRRNAAGDILQSDEIGEAMLALRAFMFERVYLGRSDAASTRARRRRSGGSSTHLVDARRRRRGRDRRLRRRDDRPLRARVRGGARLVARIKDSSVERGEGRRRTSSRSSRRGRGCGRRAARYTGLCPFHQERTPSFSVSPDRGTFNCFGCGEGGDAITFVARRRASTSSARSSGSRERFNVAARVRGVVARGGRAAAARASGSPRCSSGRPSFYERYLWESAAGAGAREYLASRGLGEEVCREFRLGLAPRRRAARAAGAREGVHAEELPAAGLVNRAGSDYFRGALVFPLADARGRVVGFQARKLREDDPLRGKYVNSPEGELFRKWRLLYGLHLARHAIAKQDRALVVEGNTDVLALRQAGFEPVVASMGTALTERAAEGARPADAAAVPLLRRGRRRRGRDAARDGARGRAGLRREGRRAAAGDRTRPTTRRRSRSGSRRGAYAVHRVRLELRRARATGSARSPRRRSSSTRCPSRPSGRRRGGSRTTGSSSDRDAGCARAGGAAIGAAGAVSPRLLDAGDRLERERARRRRRAPELAADARASSAPEHFDDELHRRARAPCSSAGARPTRS